MRLPSGVLTEPGVHLIPRVYSITALAACYDAKQTVSSVMRMMRCAGCGKPVGAAWLVDA